MPARVVWPSSSALVRRLTEIQAAARPGSRVLARCRGDLQRIVVEDHKDKMMRGVDRYGRPRAALAESTLKRRKGTGPSLVPRGLASRFVTCFQAAWETASTGVSVLVMQYAGLVDKKGRNFAHYHEVGCPPGSNPKRPKWSLPARPTMGITPKGWARVKARCTQFAQDVLRGH